MIELASLWWWLLPLVLVPIWLHRQKRARTDAVPLATAQFLPGAQPQVRRVWRWQDWLLLLVRCLLLVVLIAWLADITLPWRKDAVLVVPGTDGKWLQGQLHAGPFADAQRIAVPDGQALEWFAQHEREWTRGARVLIAGDVAMPEQRPRFRHEVLLMTRAAPAARIVRRVLIESDAPAAWQRFFTAATDGSVQYTPDGAAAAAPDLIVWDRAAPPPTSMKASLWWFTPSAHKTVSTVVWRAAHAAGSESAPARPPGESARVQGAGQGQGALAAVADLPGGRAWLLAQDAATDPAKAAGLVEAAERLHFGVQPYTAPPVRLDADPRAPVDTTRQGDLRPLLLMILAALFAAERILAHVSRRS
ncbi:BatA domain-containing protein [Zemynaea arenosa]|nr:BatA domain-containing protein [Massilia arenosa]